MSSNHRASKKRKLRLVLLLKAPSQHYFLPARTPDIHSRDKNLQQTAAVNGFTQGATSCNTTSHTQLLSDNIANLDVW